VLVLADQEVVGVAGPQARVGEQAADAQRIAHQLAGGEQLLVGGVRRQDVRGPAGPGSPQPVGQPVQGVLQVQLADAALLAQRGEPQAVVVDERVAVAPVVAEPERVDVRVRSRFEPQDAAAAGMMRPLGIEVDGDVAAAGAAGADRRRLLQVPDAATESEVPAGQRADGADVHDVGRIAIVELAAGEDVDLGVVAAVEDRHLVGLGDFAGETHAPRTEDAPFLVQHDPAADGRGLLVLDHFVFGKPAVVPAHQHVVFLEAAFAGLVADGAVHGVVDEQELEHVADRLADAVVVGPDHHAVAHRRAARDLQLRDALDLHQAHPAVARDRQAGMVAVVGDVNAVVKGGLQDRLAGYGLDGASVDGDGDLVHGY